MKPIPAEKDSKSDESARPVASLTGSASPYLGSGNTSNRRAQKGNVNRAYPWLLLLSTLAAALFFVMYITKPIIIEGQVDDSGNPITLGNSNSNNPSLLPNANKLPGENPSHDTASKKANHTHLTPPVIGKFEETNLRVQHILSAEAPGGFTGRIDVDVPVLYQSRQLRWTPDEVSEARDLLAKLTNHQSKARQLRSEGADLLKSWNQLLEKSIPAPHLRADSPSVPRNQHSASISVEDLNSNETSTQTNQTEE